ncbi:MAG: outer membrane protein assembly factor BamD [Alistipes sp.]|nr:outer membrane protein assembly factor BamD [Alistipes sp.]
MVRSLSRIFLTVAAAFAVTGCSEYYKVLKSKDPDLMYSTALDYYEAGKYSRSIQLFSDVSPYFMGTLKGDSVAFFLGASYYKSGDFDSSSMLMDDFRMTYGDSPFLEEAEYMYAKSHYYMSPEPNRDQTMTRKALIAIDEYMERYPNSVRREVLEDNIRELTQKLHDKAYLNAKTYYKIGRYKAAVIALRNALNQFPDTTHREEMMYLIAKSNYLLASNSFYRLQRDRYMDMMDSYFSFVLEYPESKYTRELEKMQASAREFLANFQDYEVDDEIQDLDDTFMRLPLPE